MTTVQERIDGLINIGQMMNLNKTIIELTEDLLEEGFDGDEIALYLRRNIADAIVVVEDRFIEKESKNARKRIKRRT